MSTRAQARPYASTSTMVCATAVFAIATAGTMATAAPTAAANLNSFTLDAAAASFAYDGHGALSAGASSRLLYDYEVCRALSFIRLGRGAGSRSTACAAQLPAAVRSRTAALLEL